MGYSVTQSAMLGTYDAIDLPLPCRLISLAITQFAFPTIQNLPRSFRTLGHLLLQGGDGPTNYYQMVRVCFPYNSRHPFVKLRTPRKMNKKFQNPIRCCRHIAIQKRA